MFEQFHEQHRAPPGPPRETRSTAAPLLTRTAPPELAELSTPTTAARHPHDDSPDVAAALRCSRSADRLTAVNLISSSGYQILLGSALVAQSVWMISSAVTKPLWGPYLDGGAGLISAIVGYFSIRFGAQLVLMDAPRLIASRRADRVPTSSRIEAADALLRESREEVSPRLAAYHYLEALKEGGARRTVRALGGLTRCMEALGCEDREVPTILRTLAEVLPERYRGLPIQRKLAAIVLPQVNTILRLTPVSPERAATAAAIATVVRAGMERDPVIAQAAAITLMEQAREISREDGLTRARLLTGAWWLTARTDPLRENLEAQLREIGATTPVAVEETKTVRKILKGLGIKG